MREENYSLASIGYIQLIKLPWILKFLWAPLVDRTGKNKRRYRTWIISSEIFYALIIMSVGYLDFPTDFTNIIALMVIAFTASATQDIATDAFAILILKKKERSLGNSMQSAGNYIGTLMGSGVLLHVYYHWGWLWLLRCLGLFVLFALIPVSLYNTRNRDEQERSTKKVSPLDFVYFFRQKKIGGHILLLFLFYSGIIGVLTMIKPYLVDLGFNIKEIGTISGIFGPACGAAMTVPAGMLIRKKGIVKAIWLFPIFNLIAATYFFVLTYSSHEIYLLYIGVALLWGAYAMSSVFVYTMGMQVVRKGREGTDFTIQIVLTHLSSLIIAVMSGKIADAITYRGLFGIEVGMGILILVLLPFIFKKKFYHKNEDSVSSD